LEYDNKRIESVGWGAANGCGFLSKPGESGPHRFHRPHETATVLDPRERLPRFPIPRSRMAVLPRRIRRLDPHRILDLQIAFDAP
jgi:hypothetical protein